MACQEACANAVEHAYGPGGQSFEVEAIRSGGDDRGDGPRPRPLAAPARDPPGTRKPMMEALMDSVEIEHTDEGTVVVLRRELGGGGRT